MNYIIDQVFDNLFKSSFSLFWYFWLVGISSAPCNSWCGNSCFLTTLTSIYFLNAGFVVDGNFLGVVGDNHDAEEGVVTRGLVVVWKGAADGFIFSGRSLPLKGSLITAGSAVSSLAGAGAAASDWRRDWWAAARAQSFSRRLGPLWRRFWFTTSSSVCFQIQH